MPANKRMPDVTIENVQLIFKNFSGRTDQFNAQGLRKFSVVLPEDVARDMENDGWNIKWPKVNPDYAEDGPRPPHIAVVASYRLFSPQVTVIIGNRRVNYTEDMLDLLDTADIISADVVLQPSNYEMNGTTGVKAYLKKLYVTIEEDELERKYSHLNEAGAQAL